MGGEFLGWKTRAPNDRVRQKIVAERFACLPGGLNLILPGRPGRSNPRSSAFIRGSILLRVLRVLRVLAALSALRDCNLAVASLPALQLKRQHLRIPPSQNRGRIDQQPDPRRQRLSEDDADE